MSGGTKSKISESKSRTTFAGKRHATSNFFSTITRTLADPEYRPLCDLDEGVSCSVAFNSSYGRGFGFVHKLVGGDEDHWLVQPNPVYGLAFYSLMALLALLNFVFTARIQVGAR